MSTQIKCVPEHHVAKRTNLDADVLFDILLHKIREQEQLESMTDTLRVKQDSIVQISDALIMSFARMAESWHLVGRGIFVILCGQDLRHKFCYARRKLLFVYHVKTGNKVGVGLLSDLDMFNHLLDVRVAYNLETSND